MLKDMQVFSQQTSGALLPLAPGGTPATDPIQIKGIDGLEPVNATISSTPFGAYDGEAFIGASVGKRNVVITCGLNPDWETQTVAELRGLLYAYFMPKLPVRLRFSSTHLPDCQIDGYVESMKANIFAKDPEIQVSILCLSPDFVAVEETVVNGVITDGTVYTPIDYEGTSPTGFVISVSGSGVFSSTGIMELLLKSPLPQMFSVSSDINHGMDLYISSITGDKYVRSISSSDGVVENLLDVMSKDSVWPQLQPGNNDMAVVTNASGAQGWQMKYFARFVGL